MFRTAFLLGAVLASACTAPVPSAVDSSATRSAEFEAGKWLHPAPVHRSVGYQSSGPSTVHMSWDTTVWDTPNRWYQVSDEAGLAWPSHSGLTWDEKYAAWVDSLPATVSESGKTTVLLTTPWGRELPSPRLECAEMAMFLRVTFASWHGLPFFMTAYSSTYGDIHYGHFGIVDDDGARLSGYPRFATAYTDYTDTHGHLPEAELLASWPDDAVLEDRQLTSSGDDYIQFLDPGEGEYAGAYMDEIFLNKRTGHFLARLLVNYGSIHLASARNTWNLQPEAIREGDLLMQRWQSQGIGHTVVVKEVGTLPDGNLDVEVIFGSMPRIQPVWYEVAIAKSYFTSQKSGGPALSNEGVPYSHLGGGLKRWRTPVLLGDLWVNIVPMDDRDEWIGSTDYEALEARVATFSDILGPLSPTERRDGLLERIRIARDNLSRSPASCANRTRREEAFDELYTLMADEWGWSPEQVDATYRELEDYIFAELSYDESKTCCWNSSTEAMYQIIVDFNEAEIADAHAHGECALPTVFKARDNGGYEPFAGYAVATGRGADWVPWSADEACPQADVLEDVGCRHPGPPSATWPPT